MSSSSFHMVIYARSKQCDLGPIYTITNTQRVRICPGKLKLILVKISPDPAGHLHGKHAKENKTLFTFLTTENLSRIPCSHECIYGAYSDLSSYAVLPGFYAFTPWHKRVGAYLGNFNYYPLFLLINFYPDWFQSPISVLRLNESNWYGQIFTRFCNLSE